MSKNPGKTIRQAIRDDKFVMAVGVYDGVTARVVQKAGFEAMYVTGHGVSNSALGLSDIGLMTFTELTQRAKAIIESVDIPVIVDADTGYGGPLNVQRTIREMTAIGAAAVQLEDQQWPKKCGHMPGKQLVERDEMCAKLRAASDARTNDLVIIARTDALAVDGLDEAVARCKLYAEAGADVVFIDAIGNRTEIDAAMSQLKTPMMVNMVEGSRTEYASAEELHKMGFKIGIWPISLLLTGITSMTQAAVELRRNGKFGAHTLKNTMNFDDFLEFWDFSAIQEQEAKYAG